ncbi:cation diffusion facilitator family transporter [Virgibacillus sp. YIM 98842]|uniref:cation diffusion facilitator family transporter n=1 Tax=Virgibacillus sp. YIM 98842 TaxID=2663533 RepID=UPI0013D8ED30|nr:cation diffusion facilitator family transporter [Virgibacillus sp. YIM 98842]
MYMNDRFQKAQFASILGIVVNLILAVIKGIGGILGNSRALLADAVHSASDVLSSIAVLVGIRAAQKPPDSEHPYGHGKAENIATLIVAILLAVVGLEILMDAISVIWSETESNTSMLALYIVLFSILVKESLFQYKNRLGNKINSPAIIADAWHHRSDAISSLIAFIGIGLSIWGANSEIPFLAYLDPIASAIIAVIIMWMGFSLGKEAVKISLEIVLDEEDTKKFLDTINKIEGVKKIDALHARSHGSYVIIDAKISVDSDITVDEGHTIAVNVKEKLMKQHEGVQDVHVHVNPYH